MLKIMFEYEENKRWKCEYLPTKQIDDILESGEKLSLETEGRTFPRDNSEAMNQEREKLIQKNYLDKIHKYCWVRT